MSIFGTTDFDQPDMAKPPIPMDMPPDGYNQDMDDMDNIPMVSFGIFSDVKYSCKPNYVKVMGPDAINHYPECSLDQLNQAISDWNQSPEPVSFLMNLGNLTERVDHHKYDRDSALVLVLNTLEKCPRPKYHVLGNCELEQFSRKDLHHSKLHSAVNAPGAVPANHDRFYYHFSPTPGVRIIVIDLYEVALVGYQDDPDCQEINLARSTIKKRNPNPDSSSSDGLSWQDARFTNQNGATTNIQLQWLVEVLDYSEKSGEIVIVCGHNPLCASDKKRFCRVPWNNEDVLNILHRFPCVVAYFSGHEATGGYLQDSNGVHHLNMPGICETVGATNCYATVHVFRNRLEVVGGGKVPSMNLAHHGQAQVITTIRREQPDMPPPQPPVIQPDPLPPPAIPQPNCPPFEIPPAPMPMVLPPVQIPAGPVQIPQLPPIPPMQPPMIINPPPVIQQPPPQPQMIPVMVRQPVTRIIKRTITRETDIGAPPPIIAARMQQQAEVKKVSAASGAGNFKRAVPVIAAVPMEKIQAMGGLKNFQLAEVPKELMKNGKVDLKGAGQGIKIIKA